MDKLRTRLRAAVVADFGGSEPKASRAAGLNPNAIGDILQFPNREPKLSTLDALAHLFGWTLSEVVYWALDQEPPTAEDYDPLAAIQQALRALHVAPENHTGIMQYVQTAAAMAAASRSAESR